MLMVGSLLKNGLYAGLFSSFGSLILTSYKHGFYLLTFISLLENSVDKGWEIFELCGWESGLGIYGLYVSFIFGNCLLCWLNKSNVDFINFI